MCIYIYDSVIPKLIYIYYESVIPEKQKYLVQTVPEGGKCL